MSDQYESHPYEVLGDPATGEEVEIDVGMVPLMQALWGLGIWTYGCCEGEEGGYAYVQFPSLADFDAFTAAMLNTDAPADDITPLDLTGNPASVFAWDYVHFLSTVVEVDGFRRWMHTPQIRFPRGHLPAVIRRAQGSRFSRVAARQSRDSWGLT